jgi:hypothetical protein
MVAIKHLCSCCTYFETGTCSRSLRCWWFPAAVWAAGKLVLISGNSLYLYSEGAEFEFVVLPGCSYMPDLYFDEAMIIFSQIASSCWYIPVILQLTLFRSYKINHKTKCACIRGIWIEMWTVRSDWLRGRFRPPWMLRFFLIWWEQLWHWHWPLSPDKPHGLNGTVIAFTFHWSGFVRYLVYGKSIFAQI